VNLTHLLSITDDRGIFEHCELDKPRVEHGYCVDDVARAMVLIQRVGGRTPEVAHLTRVYEQFLEDAQSPDGTITNRCSVDGEWAGASSTQDHWGRALWAWGTVISHSHNIDQVSAAQKCFESSATQRSTYMRSMAFAALGAIEVLRYQPDNDVALDLLADAVRVIPAAVGNSDDWPWPEPRLTYANAVIPEVLIQAGVYLGSLSLMKRGLGTLKWLSNLSCNRAYLSVTPAHGWSAGQKSPGFDQQPIEVAALVDAAATAFDHTSDEYWRMVIHRGALWFDGFNDAGIPMHDPVTGAGYDGLHETSRNENRGAESTIAYLSVTQRFNRYIGVG
jgi:hypothetical protein